MRRLFLPLLLALTALSASAAQAAVPDVWGRWGTSSGPRDTTVRSLDFTTPVTLWAGSDGDGPYSSPTALGPWEQKAGGLDATAKMVRQVVAYQGTLWAATSAGLFTGTGGSWTPVGQGTGTRKLNQGGVQSVVVNAPGDLIAAVAGASPPGIFFSSDNGEHWDRAGGLPQGENVFYMTTGVGGAPWYAAGDSGVWVSINAGRDWALASDGIPAGETTLRVAVGTDAPNNQKLYASTSSSVYRSTNGGISWSEADGLHDGTPDQILPGGAKRAFQLAPSLDGQFGPARAAVGTEGGVWGTIDDGKRWKPFSKSAVEPGDTMNRFVWALALGLGGPKALNLMAGTSGFGVYALPLQETEKNAAPDANPKATALRVGMKLTATDGTWKGTAPFFYSYQWKYCTSGSDKASCTQNVPGATAPRYILKASDKQASGRWFALVVSAQNLVSKDPVKQTSNIIGTGSVVDPPGNAPVPAPGGNPTVSPNAASYPWGTQFTANPGTWTQNGNPVSPSFSFQWQQCDNPAPSPCIDIVGATGTKYTARKEDINHHIQVLVTATANSASNVRTATENNQIIQKVPANLTKPTIIGDPYTGVTLSSTTGKWDADQPTYERRWFRCNEEGLQCNPISGETGMTHAVTAADKGSRLQLEVKATSPDQAQPRVKIEYSDPTAVITDPPPGFDPGGSNGTGGGTGDGSGSGSGDGSGTGDGSSTMKPKVTIKKPRKLKVGAKLKAPAAISGFQKIKYQWLRNGHKIKGATKRVYKIKRKDRGKTLKCRLTLMPVIGGPNVVVTSNGVKIPKAKHRRRRR